VLSGDFNYLPAGLPAEGMADRFDNLTPQRSILKKWHCITIYPFIRTPITQIGFEIKCYSKT
jgi:hypothetical protein